MLAIDIVGKWPIGWGGYHYALVGCFRATDGSTHPYIRWLATKEADEVLPRLQEMVTQIRAEFGPEAVRRLHSDRGSQLMAESVAEWAREAGIWKTFTAGYDPQRNGMVEGIIGVLKRVMRALLISGNVSATL